MPRSALPAPVVALLCCCTIPLLQRAAAQSAEHPNIVLIVADDLGYGDLSSYGAEDLETPHIDSLAASGMRFENFYANSSVCSPTRAALLSGRYPDLVGVPGVIRTHARNSWGYLDPTTRLLPQVLKDAGYQTAMVGKWHLGLASPNVPLDRGFDVFRGFLGDMMDDYHTHRRHGINYMRDGREIVDPVGHATDLFTTWAIEYIRDAAPHARYFLYLAYNAPHDPIQPPDEWLARVKNRNPGLPEDRARIAALIEHLDAGIGRVMAAIRQTGEGDNTLVVFVSDNGGALYFSASNGPLRGSKGDMYEGGLRVPMLAAWPGHIRAGSRSQRAGATMDLYPTIVEAAGAVAPAGLDGISLLPHLLGSADEALERTLFFVRREGGRRFMGQAVHAVRQGDWKLLQNGAQEPFELYNLAEDPLETTNVVAEEPAVFDRLSGLLHMHLQRAGRIPWQKAFD